MTPDEQLAEAIDLLREQVSYLDEMSDARSDGSRARWCSATQARRHAERARGMRGALIRVGVIRFDHPMAYEVMRAANRAELIAS